MDSEEQKWSFMLDGGGGNRITGFSLSRTFCNTVLHLQQKYCKKKANKPMFKTVQAICKQQTPRSWFQNKIKKKRKGKGTMAP